MTITSEITRINNNIAAAYTACDGKGATMPETQNSDNLADCIDSISSGGVGITREVSSTGVFQMPATSFTFSLPSNATDIGNYAMYYAFQRITSLTSVDFSSLTTVSGIYAMCNAFQSCTSLTSVDFSSLTTVSGTFAMYDAFYGCTSLSSVDFSGLTTVSGNNAMSCVFQSCTNLTSVLFTNLETIGVNSSSADWGQFASCFKYCSKITSITFPNLKKIYCTGGTVAAYGTFADNNKVKKMYFPKLDTITYGTGASSSDQNACKNVFYGCTSLTELHFAAANQSAIEASPGYSTAWGRGAGNVTIYFDL